MQVIIAEIVSRTLVPESEAQTEILDSLEVQKALEANQVKGENLFKNKKFNQVMAIPRCAYNLPLPNF
jgi:hypothetical protein